MSYAQYFAIEKKLKSQGLTLERKEVIQSFTSNKKSSLKELTAVEYKNMITWLNNTFPSTLNKNKSESKINTDKVQQQRRKIIALFAKMNYLTEDGKVDMRRIYAWVLKYGYLKKELNKYTTDEIPKLVHQAEEVYKSFIQSI